MICLNGWAIKSYANVEALEKDAPAPFPGLIFDDEGSGKLLRDVQKVPILEDTIKILEEQIQTLKSSGINYGEQVVNLERTVANLKQMLELQKQLLEIEKQRTSLYKERSDFYAEQCKVKDQIIEQQQRLINDLIKEANKKSFWKALAIGELLAIIGLIIGLAL